MLGTGDKKMSKMQSCPTRRHSLTIVDQWWKYHDKAQITSPAPIPIWRGRAGWWRGHRRHSKLELQNGSSSQSATLPYSCQDTLLKVALYWCFKVRANLDIIFLKTDFERKAKNGARVSLIFPWTCSLPCGRTRGKWHLGSRTVDWGWLLVSLDLSSCFKVDKITSFLWGCFRRSCTRGFPRSLPALTFQILHARG